MFHELFTIPIIGYPIKSYGFMLMLGFFSAAYMAARRAEKVRANPDIVLNCTILALLGSMAGARLFYVVHYWDTRFAGRSNPLSAVLDITKGGMEFYGGVIGAIVLTVAYLLVKRHSIRLYFDIMTPGLMWGLALTRVGCFLNGCCWGGACSGSVAEHWAVEFPYGSPAYHDQYQDNRIDVPEALLRTHPSSGSKILLGRERIDEQPPEIVALARGQKSLPVHPAQLYAAVNALLGSVFLSWVFRRRRRHGMVFAVWLLTYPWTRMILEQIRVDNPLDTFGLTVSSALSIFLIAAGLALAWWFRRLPLHSPYAHAWEPTQSSQPPSTKKR